MPLPIGFFMPLPLPIMIPFMMWQSAAIAAGFGTYFQYAKRRVSAMSNDEFNNADPHQLVESLYEDIVKSIPSSFAKVDSLTPVMLQSMNVMLDQAVKWLQGAITGNFFGTPNPVNEGNTDVLDVTPELDTGITVERSVVLAWSDTRFFLELFKVQNGTSGYDLQTRLLIQGLADLRNRPDKRHTDPDIVPDNFPTLKNFQFSPSKYSSIHRTTFEALNEWLRQGLTKKVSSRLAGLWTNAKQQSKLGRSPQQRANSQKKADDYLAMILELNKLIGA